VRIVLTVPSLAPEFGGPPAKARALAGALSGLGHEVRVVGCGEAPWAVGLPVAFAFHGTPVPRSVRALFAALRSAQVVHVIGYRDPVGLLAAAWASRRGVPFVLEPAGMYRRRLRSVRLKWLFDLAAGVRLATRARAVVATSGLEARELTADGVDPEGVVVRPNGVEVGPLLPLPERGSFRRSHGIPDDATVVLSLGRITAKKGLLDLAAALSAQPELYGAVVGPDDGDGTLAALERARRALELDGRLVVVPEGAWGERKAQVFADADLFCLPSATENFGTAAAEAACVGLPVVVSRECGVAEWLDPVASRVVRHADVADLSSALRSLAGSADARERARSIAPRLARELAWDSLAGRQAELYQEVLDEMEPTPRNDA
jgi:glycosyltransferase involved in cell wall biosynthesis